eukprot:GFYU01003758.1.p1 GENE.GFYU01003758.1~~GFYU01003758.1.p1  ORF type:complete len:564 (-),score=152.84 GFYU01003758.1:131-1822(-)
MIATDSHARGTAEPATNSDSASPLSSTENGRRSMWLVSTMLIVALSTVFVVAVVSISDAEVTASNVAGAVDAKTGDVTNLSGYIYAATTDEVRAAARQDLCYDYLSTADKHAIDEDRAKKNATHKKAKYDPNRPTHSTHKGEEQHSIHKTDTASTSTSGTSTSTSGGSTTSSSAGSGSQSSRRLSTDGVGYKSSGWQTRPLGHHTTKYQTFQALDLDGDTHISAAELQQDFSDQGLNMTMSQVEVYIHTVDTNENQQIDWREEYQTFLENMCFEYDFDQDGEISAGEIVQRLAEMGRSVDWMTANQWISNVDVSSNQAVDIVGLTECHMFLLEIEYTYKGCKGALICGICDYDSDDGISEEELKYSMSIRPDARLSLLKLASCVIENSDADNSGIIDKTECVALHDEMSSMFKRGECHMPWPAWRHQGGVTTDGHDVGYPQHDRPSPFHTIDVKFLDCFHEFDKNNDKCISTNELRVHLHASVNHWLATEARGLVSWSDWDRDGCVTYAEFVQLLTYAEDEDGKQGDGAQDGSGSSGDSNSDGASGNAGTAHDGNDAGEPHTM